jgi:2-polyprenyl-6-methoxyphenol hydroxylase-like FAD-dependent oxidoreductase
MAHTVLGRHAVVLGGSVGGLLAARAVAEHFEQVTILERDRFPEGVADRKGVPQGRHAHGLLAGGREALERWFPGVSAAVVASGGLSGDIAESLRMFVGGGYLARFRSGIQAVLASRPLLESHIRRRVCALRNVRAVEGVDVLGVTGNAARVDGVRLLRRQDGAAEETMPADLVVDATGRGSRTPAWLESLGLAAPAEDRVRVGVGYTTVVIRRRPEHLDGDRGLLVTAHAPNRRSGVALAMEGDRFMVTLIGHLGEHAPSELGAMREWARGLPAPQLGELLQDAEVLAPPLTATFPWSQRRHYQHLPRFPEGLLVTGDALCSFNPIFGQGMTVAALQAEALDRTLAGGLGRLARRFFKAAARVVDAPWMTAVATDLRFPEVEGPRPPATGLINAHVTRVQRAGARDPAAALGFLRVTHLLAPPSTLFAPGMMLRAAFAAR